MKKILITILTVSLLLSMVSCGSAAAFKISKEAYNNINTAYEKVNEFSQDIYEAWYMGINKKEDINGSQKSSYGYITTYNEKEELENFADELHIPQEDLERAVAKLLGKDAYNPGTSSEAGDWYFLSNKLNDSFFSACVTLVSTAYEENGTADEITALLEEARGQMKKLSDSYSDYEHYPNLKEYFTTTTAFFDFCLNPEGSFEQVVETFNNYRNDARNYYFDLNYVFEEELFSKDDEEEETTTEGEI